MMSTLIGEGNGTPLQYFAWKIPWMEEPGRLQSMGSLRVGHDWMTSLSFFTFMHWRRKWQPTPVFLPGESQGQGRLVAAVYGVTQNRTWLKWLRGSSSPLSLSSVQFSSVTQSCVTRCNPMNRSMPGLPVHHQLPEFTQTHIHRVSDAIQPSHSLSFPSPPAPNLSQHQSLFHWVNSFHEVAKVLEFQL